MVGAVALGLRTIYGHEAASVVMIIAFGLGIVHWIWSILDVASTDILPGSQKKFWLIGIIALPIRGLFTHYAQQTQYYC